VLLQAFMEAAGGGDQGYQPLRKIDDILSSSAFFDGKQARLETSLHPPAM